MEGGKEVGRDGETNGKRNCGRVGIDLGRKRKKGRNDRARKGRLKSVCCCH